VGRFEIKRLGGIGVLAAIYLAYDPESERDVALKVAHRTERLSKVFREEAEILAALKHPGLPEFYGYGETAELVHIAAEWVEGKDLETVFEEHGGHLPVGQAIHWAVQICDVLAYLHGYQPEPIIFRDLKPSNIMVTPSGRVCLIDFGIPGREKPPTGTEGYAPPEQYIGYADPRCDIYALGATLHHLLTGRDPRREPPFTFHEAPPRSLNPAISEELEAVIMKATEYNLEHRYQSAEEMRDALLACL
jgi:serine/threonine protein kinase